jgi:drug/metabolite transporter (DMT)-like permease
MKLFWLAALAVVIANAIFHVIQKSIPQDVNPILSVAITYAVALITTVLLFVFFPLTTPLSNELSKVNWASIALGMTIVSIEVGYLLMYRSGWSVALGPVTTYAAVTLLLLPIGLWYFKEKLVWQNVLGILVTLVGVYLLTWKAKAN